LGVAALAGGAYQVVQTDRSRIFLDLARNSCRLNALEPGGMSFHIQDFFPEVSQLKRRDERFDLVLLDPPFFSVTERGRVDLQAYSVLLINKVRPLVNHEGRIVLINNSLYLSGSDFLRSIDELCADGYLALEESIPVPYDVTGWPSTLHGGPPVSPAPFNHPTKIIVLKVKRKDGNTGM
jgi:23S rRNA (cytosine1962-C5)-methyltransferase